MTSSPRSPSAPSQLDSAACDLCGSDRHTVVVFEARDWEHGVPGVFHLARCTACDFYYQVPRPAPHAIPGFYPSTYPVYGDAPVTDWLFRMVFWLDARRMRRLVGPRGRILDVGCGGGGALAAMARAGDWELRGVELSTDGCRRARALGFQVDQGDLGSVDLPPDSFDLIRMGHVLEHFSYPVEALKRAFEVLRPGGVLVGETPNVDCWDFRLFGRYWGALHFPRHITLFSARTLQRACEQVGFVDVQIAPRLRTVGWSAGIQNVLADRFGLRVPPNGRVRWYLLLIAPFLPVTALQSLVSWPATIAVTARKP